MLLFCSGLNAQDSIQYYQPKSSIALGIIGGTFVGAGLYMEGGDRKEQFRDWVRERYEVSTTNLDDLLQHSPIVVLYGMDLLLDKSKAEIARQTRHLLVTQAATIGTSLIMKKVFDMPRPNGGSLTFPSGHTAYSFASATVMYYSFKDDNLFLALSGYIPATIVGAYRMIKDKHWVSDVLFGAGMGMLFSHLSYSWNIWDSKDVKEGKEKQDTGKLTLGGTQNGVGLLVHF